MSVLRRRIYRDQRGTAALEFGLLGSALTLFLCSMILLSFLLWTKGVVQMAAWRTARCATLGSSTCTTPSTYVASILSAWGVSGFIPTVSVTVQVSNTCSAASGTYTMVTVKGSMRASILSSLSGSVLTATACYPSGA